MNVLPNGRWTITLADSAKNAWGETIGTTSNVEIYFLLGDLDYNGTINQADIDILNSNRDQSINSENLYYGDLNNDGIVDDDDEDILMALFGAEV